MSWNPDDYAQFQADRDAPFRDLLVQIQARIRIRPGLRVIDLGCGTGHLTMRLAAALPGSDILGIDSSLEMLAEAHRRARPGLRFAQMRIEEAANLDAHYDVVFSHSALQWISDHESLMSRLITLCAPGGLITVQFPANHDHAAHQIMRLVAGETPYAAALAGWTRPIYTLPLERYAELLFAGGAADFTAQATVYPAVLADADALLAWLRGTGLLPYLDRLPEALRDPFVARVGEQFRAQWPDRPVLYAVKRFLLVARP